MHTLNLIETMFYCEYCKKYRNFIQSPGEKIFRKRTASTDSWAIHAKVDGKSSQEGIEEILALYTVEGMFIFIYLCLLISKGFNFSIKFQPPHVLT